MPLEHGADAGAGLGVAGGKAGDEVAKIVERMRGGHGVLEVRDGRD